MRVTRSGLSHVEVFDLLTALHDVPTYLHVVVSTARTELRTVFFEVTEKFRLNGEACAVCRKGLPIIDGEGFALLQKNQELIPVHYLARNFRIESNFEDAFISEAHI